MPRPPVPQWEQPEGVRWAPPSIGDPPVMSVSPVHFLLTPLACLWMVSSSPPSAAQDPPVIPAFRASVQGDAQRADSTNFSVHSQDVYHPADEVAVECERQRHQLQQRWLGRVAPPWQRRCEIVIYANENAYLRDVGWQAAMTRGVCRIDRQHNRIVARRVCLMTDPQSKELTALAHELTHLVLADRFQRCQPPRWADEGIALLADGAEKKSLHLRDLKRALADHCCPGVGETLTMRQYPQGRRLNAFYGQSLSLVSYLTELDEPAKVVEMVALAMDRGYDTALYEVYGIANTTELERHWWRHLARQQPRHFTRSGSRPSPR